MFHTLIANTVPLMPKRLVGHLSRHYIAGPVLDDAIRTAHELESEGCRFTMDVLGESISRESEARAYGRQYLQVLDRIHAEGLDCNVSIKPTQMGLGLDPALCREIYGEIVSHAASLGNFVRVDMEDTPYTDLTLELQAGLERQHPGHTGVVIQAYLRRTDRDLGERILPAKTNVRLCKGIYREPLQLAYHDRQEVRDNFLHLLRRLLENGNYVGIATHDKVLVEGARQLIEELGLPPTACEFQMLLGVLPDLRREILAAGHKLRVYIPFGEAWFAYSTRRLKENPSLVSHFMLGLFRKH